MRVIGIDPGNTGALAILDGRTLMAVEDMPVVNGRVNAHEVASILRDWLPGPGGFACVEHVHAFPRQGVSSVFTFGLGYGMVLGVLATLEIPIVNAVPSVWTKALGVGSDKEVHRLRAIETWPEQANLFARKKDDGRADAALIGLWGATR